MLRSHINFAVSGSVFYWHWLLSLVLFTWWCVLCFISIMIIGDLSCRINAPYIWKQFKIGHPLRVRLILQSALECGKYGTFSNTIHMGVILSFLVYFTTHVTDMKVIWHLEIVLKQKMIFKTALQQQDLVHYGLVISNRRSFQLLWTKTALNTCTGFSSGEIVFLTTWQPCFPVSGYTMSFGL